MSIISYIKKMFRKELTSILAPLDKIHAALDAFLDQTAMDIANNVKQIADLSDKNIFHKTEQDIALKVKDNIKNLLAK